MKTTKHEAEVMLLAKMNEVLSDVFFNQNNISWLIQEPQDLKSFPIYLDIKIEPKESEKAILYKFNQHAELIYADLQQSLKEIEFNVQIHQADLDNMQSQFKDQQKSVNPIVMTHPIFRVSIKPNQYKDLVKGMRSEIITLKRKPLYTHRIFCHAKNPQGLTVYTYQHLDGSFDDEIIIDPSQAHNYGLWHGLNGIVGHTNTTQFKILTKRTLARQKLNISTTHGEAEMDGMVYEFIYNALAQPPRLILKNHMNHEELDCIMGERLMSHDCLFMSDAKLFLAVSKSLPVSSKINHTTTITKAITVTCGNYASFNRIILITDKEAFLVSESEIQVLNQHGRVCKRESLALSREVKNADILERIFESKNRTYALHMLQKINRIGRSMNAFYFFNNTESDSQELRRVRALG